MPEQTNDVVVSGFIGLMVVRASRNEIIPAMLNTPPTSAIITDATTRMNAGAAINGASAAIPHMAPAISAVTAGGGILSSSAKKGSGLEISVFILPLLDREIRDR